MSSLKPSKIHPSLITTPIGAAIGVALTKKLVSKEDLTLNKYIIGGGIGAGAGLAAGELIRGVEDRYTDMDDYVRFVRENPSAELSSYEIEFVNKIRPDILEGDIRDLSTNARGEAAKRIDNLKRWNALDARRQVLRHAASKETDPIQKAKYIKSAEYVDGLISSAKRKDLRQRAFSSLPFL